VSKYVHRFQKSVVGVVAVATFAGVGTVASVGAALAASQALVATGNVNLRSGPGTSYTILVTVPRGASVTATGTTSGAWIQATYAGRTGYLSATYVKASVAAPTATPTTAPTATPSAAQGSVTTTGAVNIRSGAGTTFGIVGVATRGTALATTGVTSGAWTQVVWGGVARWASTSYLAATAVAAPRIASLPPVPTPAAGVRAQKVIDYATLKLGGRYLWGGTDLRKH